MIKSPAVFLVLSLLGACTNTSDDFEQIKQVLAPGQAGFVARFVTLAEAGDRVPALQVSLLDQDRSSTVLLESQRAGFDTWLSPDGATLVMRQGMLVAMHGFGAGLVASEIDQPLTMVLSGQEGASERFHSYLDGNDEINTRTYLCEIENRGMREVFIGGKPTRTRLMAEQCRSLNQSFLNLYWVGGSGNRIVQTRQWAGDYLGVFTTRVVPR